MLQWEKEQKPVVFTFSLKKEGKKIICVISWQKQYVHQLQVEVGLCLQVDLVGFEIE